MKIKDIMKTDVITASPDDTIKDVILRIRMNNITGLPVVNENNQVVGDFSEHSVIETLPDILNEAEQIPMIDVKELTSSTIRNVMTTPPITIGPENDIKDAAKLFLEKYVHRLFVVEKQHKLMGIVTLGDVLKAFSER